VFDLQTGHWFGYENLRVAAPYRRAEFFGEIVGDHADDNFCAGRERGRDEMFGSIRRR